MKCNLINHTQYPIAFTGEAYFDSGHFDIPPTNTAPAESPNKPTTMTFSICKTSGGIFTGATGGARFHLMENGVDVPFALGFCAPYAGHYKAGAAKGVPGVPGSPSAIDGYNSADSQTVTVTIKTDSGRSFTIQATAGETAQFEVTESA